MKFFLDALPWGLIAAVVAYLLGSFNSAIVFTSLIAKKDIRDSGSGNAGATNVLRSQGKRMALLTTIGDLAKAIISVFFGQYIMKFASLRDMTNINYPLIGAYLAGIFCIIGHLYPLYFKFKGGKGVMTALGLMLVLDWRVALICLSLFILVVFFSKMVSLGSIAAATSLPIFTFIFKWFVDNITAFDALFCTAMTAIFAALLILKHRDNIKRIIAGTENKIGGSKDKEGVSNEKK